MTRNWSSIDSRFSLSHRSALRRCFLILQLAALASFSLSGSAQIRDGNIDPHNLGKGDWIYFMSAATNLLGGYVPAVTNEASLMKFYRSQGVEWIVIKAATSDELFNGSYAFPQFNSNLVAIAHEEGIKIFGYNRSYGENIPGEIEIADYVFNQGADGFIFDAEAEWESSRSWIGANGPALAMQLCSAVRSNWPTKFLAHAPLPIISYHSSFPYREFGYWCDAVMPQDYWKSIGITPEYMVEWRNAQWHAWENSLTGIWTNAIKPIAPLGQGWSPSASEILTGDEITRFFTALRTDSNPPGKGGYSGISFWRADLHTPDMWDAIRTNSIVDTTTNPPTILVHPENLTLVAGATATLTVTATGTLPLSYQWRRHETNLPGATASSYVKAYAQPSDSGVYSVIVSNRFGTVISSNALLTVHSPPLILSQPESQWVTAGNDVLFSVTAQGTEPLYYQWKSNGTNIPGATGHTYSIQGVATGAAGFYSVVVSNVAGTVTSESAELTVTLFDVPPFITEEPQALSVPPGGTAIFEVTAVGTTPFFYQWKFHGTNLPAATNRTLIIANVGTGNVGPYSVVVGNVAGSAESAEATLSIGSAVQVSELWNLPGGSRPYLATSSQYERGMAYNRLTDRLLIISRVGSPQIYVLNGTTGDDLYNLFVDTSVVNGGTYTLNMIGVADDGVVYAANLATSGSGFKVYRWDNDAPDSMPMIVYDGNPAPSNIQRWGDTLDVRGSGTNTQILLGSRNGRAAAILTTTDGYFFESHPFDIQDIEDGGIGLGIAFGPGNTFYGKAKERSLVRVGFDLNTGVATVLRTFDSSEFPFAISPIGVDADRGLLAGIYFATPDTLNLYDIAIPDSLPRLLGADEFGSDNANAFYTGSVDFGDDRLYALNSNNGLLAMEFVSETAPSFVVQPADQNVVEGSPVSLSARATGYKPIGYQWRFFGTNLPGATGSALIIPSVTTNNAGPYTVQASNLFGKATSEVAMLTVRQGISLAQALDAPDLWWTTGGVTNWFGQTNVTFDGIDAARSGVITNSESTWLSTTVTGQGTISFRWKVSSEQSFDYLTFYADSNTIASISGDVDWKEVSIDLAEGTHPLLWEYLKDSSVSSGSDCGWVDNVRWFTGCSNCPPVIARHPVGIRTVQGAPATFTVKAYGAEPLHYQWRLNGGLLDSATQSSLVLPSVTLSHEGVYSVVISNQFGVVPSSDAPLSIVLPVTQVFDDFDPGIDLTQWFELGGEIGVTTKAANYGGSVSGANSLWFGGDNDRYAVAAPVQTGTQGVISYFLRLSGSTTANWEIVDLPGEGVVLEASKDGGLTWSTLATHNTTAFYQWTFVSMDIPANALSGATLFRWRQLNHSGTCCDHWALDDVRVVTGAMEPTIAQQPANLTVMEGRTARLTVGAWGTGPLVYRWYHNGDLLPGATTAMLAITNVQLSNAGPYSVSVSNTYGFVISSIASLTVIPKPPCVPTPANLVAWWQAEENMFDSVGLSDLAAGSYQPLPPYEEGMVGSAFRIEGQYLSTPASASLDVGSGPGLTIEGWISPSGNLYSQSSIAEWVDASSPSSALGLSLSSLGGSLSLQGTITTTNRITKTFRTSAGTITTNAWQHVALTYSRTNGTAVLYINGSAIAQTNVGSLYLLTKAPFAVGGRAYYGYYFRGLLDEISVYSRDLATAEIHSIYAAGAGGKCPAPPPSCVPAPQDIAAWWRGQSNETDTVSLNDGYWAGSQYSGNYTNGRVGLALAFNGSYVTIPKTPELDVGNEPGLTVEGWVKLGNTYSTGPIIEWSDATSRVGLGFAIMPPGILQATLTASNAAARIFQTPANVLASAYWQHVAVTYSKTDGLASIYLNGTEIVRTNLGSLRPATATDVYLGYKRSNGSRMYGGALDEISVYKRALAAGEIHAIVAAREAGKCVPPQFCEPPAAGMIGWWQAESNALSRIPGLPGQAVNMSYRPGKVGAAFNINKSSSYVRVPASPLLNVGNGSGFTLEAWIYPSYQYGGGPIAEWNSGNGTLGPSLYLNEPSTYRGISMLTANIVDTDGVSHLFYSPTGAIAASIWQHVGLTYDKASGMAVLYLNGRIITQTNLGTFTPRTSYDLYFGYRASGNYSGAYLNGGIDEPTLYNRALTPAEIRAVAFARNLGKCDEAPIIVQGPRDLRINEGETAVLETLVSGTPPLFYSWRWNLSQSVPNQTSSTLVLTNVQYSQRGMYNLQVTNIFGSAMSTGATLTVNRAPIAQPRQVLATEDTPAAIILDASDPDLDPLTFIIMTGPAHGTLSGSGSNLVYTPAPNYWGPDSFTFMADDGLTNSAGALVSISVASVNDRPEAYADSFTIAEESSVSITLWAADADGDALTFTVTQPAHGLISGVAPNIVYSPATNYNGSDTFTFEASDGKLTSVPAQVSITITPVNDAPVAKIVISPLAQFPQITNLVVIATNSIEATVTLDGSQSSDADNDPLTYAWFQGTNWLSDAPVTTMIAELGSHEITLVVDDGQLSGTNIAAFEVITPSEATGLLIDLIQNSGLTLKDQQPLQVTLRSALASFNRGSNSSGLNQLEALKNKVSAQLGRTHPELAAEIIQAIEGVLNSWARPGS